VHIARGELSVNGTRLATGDGARIRNEERITFEQGKEAEVLLFDLRAHEAPVL
jgi:quercetin 2,3-dioxygenase